MSPTNRFLGLSCLTASLCLPLISGAPAARADTIPVKSAELRVEDESYDLNAQFDVAFNPRWKKRCEGVSLYFVLEFELSRPALVLARRRLVQQTIRNQLFPLTRRYRAATGLLSQQLNRWRKSSICCRASFRARSSRSTR
jgi:hypothetical protein